jgi:ElaA protein
LKLSWKWQKFSDIAPSEVYEMLAVRQQVFVVEQECLYLDADGLDAQAWHLFGCNPLGELIAYARILPPNTRYQEPSIGRVLICKAARGRGIGHELMTQCLRKCQLHYAKQAIRISAQAYLCEFYQSFGFEPQGQPYDDGGIAHISMVLKAHSDRPTAS